MRIRDGPAAVRGDAPPPRSHWRKPGRRRGREPRVRRPAALPVSRSPRGREDSGASPACPTRRGGARCARALGRRRVRWSDENVGVPGHRRRLQRQGHRHEAAGPHRLAVADGNGDVCSRSAPGRRSSPSTTSPTTRRTRRGRPSRASRRTWRRSPRTGPISSSSRTTRRVSRARSGGSASPSCTRTARRASRARTSRSASSGWSRVTSRPR